MFLCDSLWRTSALEEAPEGWVTGSWQNRKEESAIRRDQSRRSVQTLKAPGRRKGRRRRWSRDEETKPRRKYRREGGSRTAAKTMTTLNAVIL